MTEKYLYPFSSVAIVALLLGTEGSYGAEKAIEHMGKPLATHPKEHVEDDNHLATDGRDDELLGKKRDDITDDARPDDMVTVATDGTFKEDFTTADTVKDDILGANGEALGAKEITLMTGASKAIKDVNDVVPRANMELGGQLSLESGSQADRLITAGKGDKLLITAQPSPTTHVASPKTPQGNDQTFVTFTHSGGVQKWTQFNQSRMNITTIDKGPTTQTVTHPGKDETLTQTDSKQNNTTLNIIFSSMTQGLNGVKNVITNLFSTKGSGLSTGKGILSTDEKIGGKTVAPESGILDITVQLATTTIKTVTDALTKGGKAVSDALKSTITSTVRAVNMLISWAINPGGTVSLTSVTKAPGGIKVTGSKGDEVSVLGTETAGTTTLTTDKTTTFTQDGGKTVTSNTVTESSKTTPLSMPTGEGGSVLNHIGQMFNSLWDSFTGSAPKTLAKTAPSTDPHEEDWGYNIPAYGHTNIDAQKEI